MPYTIVEGPAHGRNLQLSEPSKGQPLSAKYFLWSFDPAFHCHQLRAFAREQINLKIKE